jgi:hypothetical protein
MPRQHDPSRLLGMREHVVIAAVPLRPAFPAQTAAIFVLFVSSAATIRQLCACICAKSDVIKGAG